jgi:hypothetical protein
MRPPAVRAIDFAWQGWCEEDAVAWPPPDCPVALPMKEVI